jgi:hypothetical protein
MQNRMITRTFLLAAGYLAAGSSFAWTAALAPVTASDHCASRIVATNGYIGAASSLEVGGTESASSRPRLFRPNYASFAITLRHWDKPVLNVYVDAVTNEGKTEEQTNSLITQAMALWNDKLGAAVHLQPTTDAESADITLAFTPAGTLEGGAIGRTDVNFRIEDQILTHAAVRINQRLPSAELVQVAAHELGHALGIQGHSNDRRDLMYPYAHLPAEVTDRDLGTMAISYPTAQPVVTAATPSATPAPSATSSENDNTAEFPTAHQEPASK